MTKRRLNLTKRHRHRVAHVRYMLRKTDNNYVYVKRTYNGKTTGPSLYNVKHLAEWMITGMNLIDLAVNPAEAVTNIPGFGGKYKGTYVFYQEGGREAGFYDN